MYIHLFVQRLVDQSWRSAGMPTPYPPVPDYQDRRGLAPYSSSSEGSNSSSEGCTPPTFSSDEGRVPPCYCVSNRAKLLTKTGWAEVGKLLPFRGNHEVWSGHKWVEVELQPADEDYETEAPLIVEIEKGPTVVCSGQHCWGVVANNQMACTPTEHLKTGDRLLKNYDTDPTVSPSRKQNAFEYGKTIGEKIAKGGSVRSLAITDFDNYDLADMFMGWYTAQDRSIYGDHTLIKEASKLLLEDLDEAPDLKQKTGQITSIRFSNDDAFDRLKKYGQSRECPASPSNTLLRVQSVKRGSCHDWSNMVRITPKNRKHPLIIDGVFTPSSVYARSG